MSLAELELRLFPSDNGSYRLDLLLRHAGGAGLDILAQQSPVTLNEAALRATGDAGEYGRELSRMLFASSEARQGWRDARQQAKGSGQPLRVRIVLQAHDALANRLRWETLCDPDRDTPLMADGSLRFARATAQIALNPIALRPRTRLRLLVAAADPLDAASLGLAHFDSTTLTRQIIGTSTDITAMWLLRSQSQIGPTLDGLVAGMGEADGIFLVAHGVQSAEGELAVILEDEIGKSRRASVDELVRRVGIIARKPLVIFLASCGSAGRGYDDEALHALGPRLAAAGVPVVVAMQGDVSVETATRVAAAFFRELSYTGQVEEALAAARTQVLGRDDWWMPVLYSRLTDGVIWAESQAPAPALPAATATEIRQRTRMLQKVRDFWIDGVLEKSLYRSALIQLGLEQRPDATAYPWQMIVERPDQARQQLPTGTRLIDVFKECNGELLILGDPGSGKTTILLDLARQLLQVAERDPIAPMPVVFNLSSWAIHRLPLAEWLIEELNLRYEIPHHLGQTWVEQGQILLLLDGLDEVQREHRLACAQAINQYRGEHGTTELVVCSRTVDYEAIGERLRLTGAVALLPLTEDQITRQIALSDQLPELQQRLSDDPVSRQLAQSPLMLSILLLTYGDGLQVRHQQMDSLGAQRRRLFETYVERMLARKGEHPRYATARTRTWLSWLARSMDQQAQSAFAIEQLQPEWLTMIAERRSYAVLDRVGWAALIGSGVWLIGLLTGWYAEHLVGLVVAALVGLFGGTFRQHSDPAMRRSALVHSAGHAIAGGLLIGYVLPILFLASYAVILQDTSLWGVASISGLVLGPIYGLLGALAGTLLGLPSLRPRTIVPVEGLRWSASQARSAALRGGVSGWTYGIVASIAGSSGLVLSMLTNGEGAFENGLLVVLLWLTLLTALLTAIGLGAMVGLIGGLSGAELSPRTHPNQGLRRSLRSSLASTLIGMLCIGIIGPILTGMIYFLLLLIMGQGPQVAAAIGGWQFAIQLGLFGGMLCGLAYGGYACLSHVALRIILWRRGHLPWDVADFLDFAADRLLLRKVGGSYIFIHRMVLEYFAGSEYAGAFADEMEESAVVAEPEGASVTEGVQEIDARSLAWWRAWFYTISIVVSGLIGVGAASTLIIGGLSDSLGWSFWLLVVLALLFISFLFARAERVGLQQRQRPPQNGLWPRLRWSVQWMLGWAIASVALGVSTAIAIWRLGMPLATTVVIATVIGMVGGTLWPTILLLLRIEGALRSNRNWIGLLIGAALALVLVIGGALPVSIFRIPNFSGEEHYAGGLAEVDVLRARVDIPTNTTFDPGTLNTFDLVEFTTFGSPADVPKGSLSNTTDIEGFITVRTIHAGEALTSDSFIGADGSTCARGIDFAEMGCVAVVAAREDLAAGALIAPQEAPIELRVISVLDYDPTIHILDRSSMLGLRMQRSVSAGDPITRADVGLGYDTVVARQPIPAGTTLTDTEKLLDMRLVPADDPAHAEQTFTRPVAVYGARTIRDLAAGEALTAADIEPGTLPVLAGPRSFTNGSGTSRSGPGLITILALGVISLLAFAAMGLFGWLLGREARRTMRQHTIRWLQRLYQASLVLALIPVGLFVGTFVFGLSGALLAQRSTASGMSSNILPTEVPAVEVVRARVDMLAGTRLDNDVLLETVEIPITEFEQGQNFTRLEELQFAETARPIRALEPIRRADLVYVNLPAAASELIPVLRARVTIEANTVIRAPDHDFEIVYIDAEQEDLDAFVRSPTELTEARTLQRIVAGTLVRRSAVMLSDVDRQPEPIVSGSLAVAIPIALIGIFTAIIVLIAWGTTRSKQHVQPQR